LLVVWVTWVQLGALTQLTRQLLAYRVFSKTRCCGPPCVKRCHVRWVYNEADSTLHALLIIHQSIFITAAAAAQYRIYSNALGGLTLTVTWGPSFLYPPCPPLLSHLFRSNLQFHAVNCCCDYLSLQLTASRRTVAV